MRLLFIFIFIAQGVIGQIGMGQWRLHVPSKKAADVVALNDGVYTAYENGVSQYDFASKEITLWNAVNSLSDISVTCLGKYTPSNTVFIGYDNGNIDKISNNKVTNIPAIKLAQIQGSKRINKLVEHGNYIYAATGFAIVKIDPSKDEVRDTYYPTNGNAPILDIAFRGDSIYALTEDRLYKGLTNNIILADPTQWEVDPRVPVLTSNDYIGIELVNNDIFIAFNHANYGQDSVFILQDAGLEVAFTEDFGMEVMTLNNVNNRLCVSYFEAALVYESDFSIQNYIGGYAPYTFTRAVAFSDGDYWVADEVNGLILLDASGSFEAIEFSGPPKSDFFSMDWQNGTLAIAGGGLTNVAQTYNGSGIYLFEEEEWMLKDANNMTFWNGQNVWDILSVAINPVNPNQIAAGTYSHIPLSLLNKDGQVTDTITPTNSIIESTSLGNGSSLVSDVAYDESGNLWVLNGYANKPLKVYTKDGGWYDFDLGSAAKNRFTGKLKIDYNGNKWLAVRDAGLFGYNDNGSITSSSDDKYVFLNTGENTGGLPSSRVNAIAVDFDNEIWIGTDAGFAVLYNSASAFDAGPGDYNAQRIKLEYEGNVEYVLGATDITAIVVDGANRKWFGTANSGIVLLSADGLEIIEQHTMENSPLISNAIFDLAMDHSTGELYIITDKGLVSYRTDATYEDPDYENVVVFPNPVRPDFSGPITIQGIRYNSDVKITDVAGNLVYSTTSNGGTATWDGKTLMGERVTTGVYLIWTAANEGKGRHVGKVVVVN